MFSQLLNYRGHYKTSDSVWTKRAVMFLVLLTASWGFAQSSHSKVARELEGRRGKGRVDVIIQYKMPPEQKHFDKVMAKGGALKADLKGAINGAAFSVPESALEELAADPDVLYVSPDRSVAAFVNPSNTDFYAQAVFAQAAWAQYTGSGIGIALIDSGITNNGDFGNRIVYTQSFIPAPTTTYGHGTHVAGILAGGGNNSTGSNFSKTFAGIANGANIINLRVLDQNGASSDSVVISAIQKAISLKSTYNIRVMNLSLGRPVYESYALDPLCQAVEQAWKAGIVVVVAAGNNGRDNSLNTNGYGTITAPGNDPYVITVGAMKPMGTPGRSDDQIASYSSKGPTLLDHVVKPDLVAPGNLIISTLASTSATLFTPSTTVPTNYYNNYGNWSASTAYFKLSGTSMATPVVSGAG
jgi:serine protease AprX